MIVVDTAVWIDHIRKSDRILSELLAKRHILVHPFVVGELAVGSLGPKDEFLRFVQKFPAPVMARNEEVLEYVAVHKLFGLGLGFVDVHLLASVQLTPEAQLWTRDKRLGRAAHQLGIEYVPTLHPLRT